MHDEFGRALERLQRAREVVAVGKLSGAVGTSAHLSPEVEAHVCKKLGLRPAPIATQVVQRDIHAEFMTHARARRREHRTLGDGIPPPATHRSSGSRRIFRQRPERFQRHAAQAQPHHLANASPASPASSAATPSPRWKTSPSGTNATSATAASSASSFPIPARCSITCSTSLTKLTEGLIVYPENMKRNLGLSLGMWNSQTVLLALIKKGLTREQAYDLVQRNAMKTWEAKHAGSADADFLEATLSRPRRGKTFHERRTGKTLLARFPFQGSEGAV